jgi:hypothetical protein
MGSNRQGRQLIYFLAALTLASAGCKKDKAESEQPAIGEEVPEADPSQVRPQPGNPHGGMEMGGDPHGSMNMRGGGGSMLEKTAEGRAVLGPVTMELPKGWQERATKGSMRAAEFTIPGDAELVIYYFGQNGAGSVEDNLARWHDQFQADAGGASPQPKVEKKPIAGMPATLTEVEGHYVAAMRPGAPEKHDKPGHALLGAIVETSSGPYYFKLVGPKAAVAAVRGDFHALLDSLKPR